MVSLELESWEVKVDCPITSLAACPVVKSAAHTAAAEIRNMEIHFMRNVVGPESLVLESSIIARLSACARMMPRRHTGVLNRHALHFEIHEQQALCRFMPIRKQGGCQAAGGELQ